MENVYSWAATVTVCSVIACIVEILTSNSSLEKTVRFVLGVFMLCVITVPIMDTVTQIEDIDISTEYEYDENSNEMKEAQIKILKSRIKELVEKTLGENDIKPLVTLITIDIDDNSNIKSINASVTLQDADAQAAVNAEKLIRTELGIECNVSIY